MSTLCAVISWICAYGTFYRKAVDASEAIQIPEYACYIEDFDNYYMDNRMKRIMEATELTSAAQTAARYAKYISKHSKRWHPNVVISNMFSLRKFTPFMVLERIHKYHMTLLGENTISSCSVESIGKDMYAYNNDRVVGSDACLVGTNLRKIDHLYTLVLKASLADIHTILNFFLPELTKCWLKCLIANELQQYRDIMLRMRNVASRLRLKQNIEYFKETKLALRHVVKYVPTTKLEHTEDGHFKITDAFNWLIQFIEEKSVNKKGVFRVDKGNIKHVRALLFAVVSDAKNIPLLPPVYDSELSSAVTERVVKRLINILAIPLNKAAEKMLESSDTDVTRCFLRLTHNVHGGQTYIEAMLVEIIRLGTKLAKNSAINKMDIHNICVTPLSAMFHIPSQSTLKGLKGTATAAKICEKLVTHWNEKAISEHFDKHLAAGMQKKTLWNTVKSHFIPPSVSSDAGMMWRRLKSSMNHRRTTPSDKAVGSERGSSEYRPTSLSNTPITSSESKYLDESDNEQSQSIDGDTEDGTAFTVDDDDIPYIDDLEDDDISLSDSLDAAAAIQQETSMGSSKLPYKLFPSRSEARQQHWQGLTADS